jgi:uncharacterized protein (DUF169 family)
LPTDAVVHPTRQAMTMSTPCTHSMTASASQCCCMVFCIPTSAIQSCLTKVSEILR